MAEVDVSTSGSARRVKPLIFFFLLLAVACTAHRNGAPRQPLTPEAVAGCYELSFQWLGGVPLHERVKPPARLYLTWSSEESDEPFWVVEPMSRGDCPFVSWSIPEPDVVTVWCNDGYTGVEVRLTVEGDRLVGLSTTDTDVGLGYATARVTARRISCGPRYPRSRTGTGQS